MKNEEVRNPSTDTDHGHESQCQSPNGEISGRAEKRTLSEGEFGKGALSANLYFFGIPS
jgi:hypothetical protein